MRLVNRSLRRPCLCRRYAFGPRNMIATDPHLVAGGDCECTTSLLVSEGRCFRGGSFRPCNDDADHASPSRVPRSPVLGARGAPRLCTAPSHLERRKTQRKHKTAWKRSEADGTSLGQFLILGSWFSSLIESETLRSGRKWARRGENNSNNSLVQSGCLSPRLELPGQFRDSSVAQSMFEY